MTDNKTSSRSSASAAMPHAQMLINYVPGEECRVAIVEDGKLEELHTERFAAASNVGNIYVGKVMNVEPAIQAAFVDFGMGENGFLHVTDLHPRYFPGEDNDATERVGIKTPRRERPPIQAALRRGDEIIVQVLKEGVGTKGPTLTSYLSIPGRFLVMMPYMDKVGVSRKVEDEEERRKMREILDQLELPDGFGFILRTAGMSRNKTELKRDLSYLQRLWKDMDKRLKTGGKPRLLYSESDLLVRVLRDMLSNDIHEVVIDNDAALRRAARFLKIVAPRTSTKLLHFQEKAPLFHAYGIEQQIALIHAREVPLPSGGRLVIDQTEALVAIDVNSGKSRDSRNSEDNAYQTNVEAVDEICRQLRLRDMGGIVINDLIDMRLASHRKDIQKRFDERLKRDRAKTTVLAISEFGILEMTRQRMRPSHESVHFTDCPTCRGRGMLQKPDSVAADALRDLAAILDVERVARVEMVVAPRVAGDLLSSKRLLLGRIERTYGKHVDVRVSETVQVDRVGFYAYAADGNDIDLTNLPKPKKPKELVEWVDPEADADWSLDVDEELKAAAEPEPATESAELDVHPIELDLPDDGVPITLPKEERRRGRGGRGGRGRGGRGREGQQQGAPQGQPAREDRRPERGRQDQPRQGQNQGQGRQEQGRHGGGGHGGGGQGGGRGPRQDMQPHRDRGPRDHRGPRHGQPQDDAAEWGEPPVPGAPVVDPMDDQEPVSAPAGGFDSAPPQMNDTGMDENGQGLIAPNGPGATELGPDGQPRKRRRRRRRRGRGGQGQPGQAQDQTQSLTPGQESNGNEQQQPAPRQPGAFQGVGNNRPQRLPQGEARTEEAHQFVDEPDTGDDEGAGDEQQSGEQTAPIGEGAEGMAGANGPGGNGAPGEGGGKRRRRRRRGRGGRGGGPGGANGGEGQPQGQQSAPQSGQPSGQPERQARPPQQSQQPREERSAPQRQQPMPPLRSEPKPIAPVAAAAPAPGIKPPPRALYSNVRRRVPPGKLKGPGGDE